MATVRERNGRFTAMVRKAGHAPMTQTFSSKRNAEQWARRIESNIEQGKVVETGRHSMSDAIDRYKNEHDHELGTKEKNLLDWWSKQLGDRRMSSLRRSDFFEARDKLRKAKSRLGGTIAPATINRRLSAISAVLTAAMAWEWINANPARIPRLTENNQRERLLTGPEQQRLLKACSASTEPALYPFIVALMSSGARAGELLALRWAELDLDAGIARLLKTKSGKRRAIPIRGHALELLADMAKERAGQKVVRLDETGHVFRNADGSAPFKYRESWVIAVTAAKVDDFRVHDLRHLAASTLAMAGASQRELQEVLGHDFASHVVALLALLRQEHRGPGRQDCRSAVRQQKCVSSTSMRL